MQAYQKKTGKKHKISPRSTRSRSLRSASVESVPDDSIESVPNDQNQQVNNPGINMAEGTDANLNPMERLDAMMSKMCKNVKELTDKITTMQTDIMVIKDNQTANYDKLNDKLADCQKENSELKTELSKAVDRIDTLEQCYGNTYNSMERERKAKKANNIIIRGVPEKENEKMFETMNEFMVTLNGEVTYVQTDGATRIGTTVRGQQRGHRQAQDQPRPIRLFCTTRLQKGVLYRGIQNIRKNQKFANVTLSNDLDNDRMLVRKEVYTIFTAAKKIPDVQVRMKGEAIEIDNRTYRRDQFQNLPHGITLENASTVQTPDGVAFQGHGSPVSSLYQCEIDDGFRVYNCVEQQYVYYQAVECRDFVASAKVLCEVNPYTILEIGKSIVKTKEWEEVEGNILKQCHRLKLQQNEDLRRKLQGYNTGAFYEATFSREYGAGFKLETAEQGMKNPPRGYKNSLGVIINELMEELKD